ncbi:MAG TPA: HAMP domain-containing sensor histidine kinase, partial [Verrucomicrobiae bacterium]|nr:HAMP domain-containing sensor histidine kinase [Verrucomicrobiae bacterium]
HEQEALQLETAFLEEIVAERGRQMEEGARALGGFCRAMAEKLGGPVADVRSSMRDLMERCSPGLGTVGKALAGRVVTATAVIEQLTRELQAFDELEKADIALEKVDLRLAVESAWEQLRNEHKGATLTVQRPLIKAWGNPVLVGRIASIFLSNALKFVARGETASITVGTGKHGNMVRLWFEDNGIGVEPARRERIFNLLESPAREDRTGGGIGLALARKAAAQMRGSVGLESGAARGSRFWLELPAREEKEG